MRFVSHIGVSSTNTIICAEIEWRIDLIAIHNMVTEYHYKIVVIIALAGAAVISCVFCLCNGNGIVLTVHIKNIHVARCSRESFRFFLASRAVQRIWSVSERYFIKPVVLKVNVILVSAMLFLQQRVIDQNTDRVLLFITDGYGEGLVGINRLGFPIHKVRDCGVSKFVFSADSCRIIRIILGFKLFVFV